MAKSTPAPENSVPKPRPKLRGPGRFRQTETARVVRAALSAGLPVARVEVDPASGKITVIAGAPEVNKASELDTWMEAHADSAQRT